MKQSFVLYNEYIKHIERLPMEKRGVLFTAILHHQNGLELPEMDDLTAIAFSFIREQLTRDTEKYNSTIEKRRAAALLGGAPKGNQNAKKQPKQPNQPNGCFNENPDENAEGKKQPKQPKQPNGCFSGEAGNTRECALSQKTTKTTKQPKQPDNVYVDDIHTQKISTDVPTHNSKAQADFFKRYPFIIDNYSAADYAQIDFTTLLKRFEESSFLRTRKSFSWVCSNYRKIAAGEYKDFNRGIPPPPPAKASTLGDEWGDLE